MLISFFKSGRSKMSKELYETTQLLLLHFSNKSVVSTGDGTIPTYNGNDYYIPPFHSVVLVPCNSDDPGHLQPSREWRLVYCTSFSTIENVPLIVTYLIKNTSNDGLLLQHGNLLGVYYNGAHAHIKAERFYLLINDIQWTNLIMGGDGTGWIMMPEIHWN